MLPEKKSSSFAKIRPVILTGLIPISIFFFIHSLYRPKLPDPKHPITLYSNQAGDNLKSVILRALQETKYSIFLQIYGCTDPSIVQLLKKKSSEGKSVKVFYDPSGSEDLYKTVPGAVPILRHGLMHKKILITDNASIFIGTANLTPTSLCMHDNLIIGIRHEPLAKDLQYSAEQKLRHRIGAQTIEFWHLPDNGGACTARVLSLLNAAKTSIFLAQFTFTRSDMLQALAEAKKRGVRVEVALDSSMVEGACKATLAFLRKHDIPTFIGKKGKLLHHKWCRIDEEILLIGSANWTKSAFTINEDCLLLLYPLTKEQNILCRKIRNRIEKEASKIYRSDR